MIPTTPSVTARSFETAVSMAVEQATTSGEPVMLVFDDVAVQVDPGDGAVEASRHFHEAEQSVLTRMSRQPLLSDGVRKVAVGDVIETIDDDHYTRIMNGMAGIVTDVTTTDGVAQAIVVRFPRRTVDYQSADFGHLRFVR